MYLFTHKALAKVFRAKLMAALAAAGLALPERYPEAWAVDCKAVGSGESALIYLGRYLYRGVIAEKDKVRIGAPSGNRNQWTPHSRGVIHRICGWYYPHPYS